MTSTNALRWEPFCFLKEKKETSVARGQRMRKTPHHTHTKGGDGEGRSKMKAEGPHQYCQVLSFYTEEDGKALKASEPESLRTIVLTQAFQEAVWPVVQG